MKARPYSIEIKVLDSKAIELLDIMSEIEIMLRATLPLLLNGKSLTTYITNTGVVSILQLEGSIVTISSWREGINLFGGSGVGEMDRVVKCLVGLLGVEVWEVKYRRMGVEQLGVEVFKKRANKGILTD